MTERAEQSLDALIKALPGGNETELKSAFRAVLELWRGEWDEPDGPVQLQSPSAR